MSVIMCRYCDTFFNSTIRITTGADDDGEEGDTPRKTRGKKKEVKHTRFCIHAGKMIPAENPICDNFELTSCFICYRNHYQINLEQCIAKQTKLIHLNPECTNCDQKEEIREIRRYLGLRERKRQAEVSAPESTEPISIPSRSAIIKRS